MPSIVKRLCTNVYGEIKAMPAHSMLMPGFPASDTEGALTSIKPMIVTLPSNISPMPVSPMAKASRHRNSGCAVKHLPCKRSIQPRPLRLLTCLGIEIEVSNQGWQGLHGCAECRSRPH